MNSLLSGMRRHPRVTIALCSLLWGFCYPPFPGGLLGFVVLAPAFYAVQSLRPRQAFSAFFTGGLLYNLIMYWWIYNVVKVGPALVVSLGLVCLIAFLSLFNGLLGFGFRQALRHPALLAAYPLAWAGLEAFRALGEMSFPWNNLGYGLGHWLSLMQFASVFGVYGLSTLMVYSNLAVFQALRATGRHRWRFGFAAAIIPVWLLIWGEGSLLFSGKPLALMDIALVQPSIPQTKKWDEKYFTEVMAKTFRTLEGPKGDMARIQNTGLVVMAETAVPDFLRTRPEIIDSLSQKALQNHSPILIGALDFVPDRKPWREYQFYNSAFLFHPQAGTKAEQYSKLRLVPFSEKLPFENIFPILNYVNLGEGDFSPGEGYRIWGDSIRYAPSICYEVIYPEFVRHAKRLGARFLVNITNDGWFGRSNGPYQHANIARFRAVESGIPLARCANSGVSVFYDAWGRDLGHTELLDSTVLRRNLPIADRSTFYARHGDGVDAFFLLALGFWIVGLFVLLVSRRKT